MTRTHQRGGRLTVLPVLLGIGLAMSAPARPDHDAHQQGTELPAPLPAASTAMTALGADWTAPWSLAPDATGCPVRGGTMAAGLRPTAPTRRS